MTQTITYELVVFYWAWMGSAYARNHSGQYINRKEFIDLDDARTARDLINKYIGDKDYSYSDEYDDLLYSFTTEGAYFTMPAVINKVTRESIK